MRAEWLLLTYNFTSKPTIFKTTAVGWIGQDIYSAVLIEILATPVLIVISPADRYIFQNISNGIDIECGVTRSTFPCDQGVRRDLYLCRSTLEVRLCRQVLRSSATVCRKQDYRSSSWRPSESQAAEYRGRWCKPFPRTFPSTPGRVKTALRSIQWVLLTYLMEAIY